MLYILKRKECLSICSLGTSLLFVIKKDMPKYDINDPTDLDIMRAQFDMITREEWEEYIEDAEAMKMGYKNINILKTAARKAGISKYLSPKVVNWILSVVDQIEESYEEDDFEEEES